MFNLLQIEWLKVKKYNTFWILIGIFTALLFGWNYMVSSGLLKLGNGDMNILNLNYTFPLVWPNVAYWSKFFSGLIAIIIIILTTNEYQFRTNRQNVIDGWKREQFYHAKWGIVIVLSLGVTLLSTIIGFFFALIYGSPIANAGTNMVNMLYVLLLTLNYFGFALTLSLLLKRSGMTVIIFLLYLYIVEIMLQKLLDLKVHASVGSFLPMQCSADLIGFPMMDSLKKMMPQSGPSNTVLIIASLCWIVAYYVIGRVKMLKSDW